jgi:hypothetical protein
VKLWTAVEHSQVVLDHPDPRKTVVLQTVPHVAVQKVGKLTAEEAKLLLGS